MKYFTILLVILMFPIFLFSQTLNIYLNNGSAHQVDIGSIDKITFSIGSGGGEGGIPCQGVPTVTYAGKTYNTVQIGTQCWLKENLDVGTMIVSDSAIDNQTDNSIIEKYCYHNNIANCDIYGGLYQWNEAMQYVTTEGTQGICPNGWHIPTIAEYQILSDSVGESANALVSVGSGTGTNTSGFSALYVGFRYLTGTFYDSGFSTYFWSSNVFGGFAHYIYIETQSDTIVFYNNYRENGYSIRCIKD